MKNIHLTTRADVAMLGLSPRYDQDADESIMAFEGKDMLIICSRLTKRGLMSAADAILDVPMTFSDEAWSELKNIYDVEGKSDYVCQPV